MGDLKTQIQAFFKEVEFNHLKKLWAERLIDYGIDEKDAGLWVVEIGHVVDAYRSNLTRLADLLQETDADLIPEEVYNWVIGTLVDTIPVLTEPLEYLQKQLVQYSPDESNNDS